MCSTKLGQEDSSEKNYSFYDASARYMLDSARLAAMKQKDMRTALMEIPGVMVIGEEITYRGKNYIWY